MRRASELTLIAGLLLATLAVSRADDRARDRQREPTAPNASASPLLYVATDKPLYRPGETIWFRAWERSPQLQPVSGDRAVLFELVDPRGATVASRKVRSTDGRAANDIALGRDWPGGAYTLRASSDLGATAERAIAVASYEVPRIKKTVELQRSSYGPGDSVTAAVEVARSTGEPLVRASLSGLVWLDGQRVASPHALTDRRGRAALRFELPKSIARGDCLLTVLISEGGATESAQIRVPIALDHLAIELRPEGGDLVVGLPARVYVRARDPLGKPVDIRGTVVDDLGRAVTEVEARERGLGRFELTPELGRTYALHVAQPHGIRQATPLPPALTEGCALRAVDDLRSEQRHLVVRAACTNARGLVAVASLRGRELARAEGRGELRLPMPTDAQGAVRVTLFDAANGRPLAERAIYRGLGRDLSVSLRAHRDAYTPRGEVVLEIETRNARGEPISADVALAVVDDAVLNLAGDRSGHILAHMYLRPELPGQLVDDPDYYFGNPEAMDLLMGTAGWRRLRASRSPASAE